MLQYPQWKASLHLHAVSDDDLILFDEDDYALISGKTFTLLADHLDGKHDVNHLTRLLMDQISAPELYYALTLLQAQGYIVQGSPAPREQAAFWNSLSVDMPAVASRLKEAAVAIHTVGNVSSAGLDVALGHAGISVADHADFKMVITDDYLRPELETINRQSLADGRSWMLVKAVGNILWIGPIFEPQRTACWKCLAQRLHSNRQIEAFLRNGHGPSAPFIVSVASLPNYLTAVYNFAAMEVAKYFVLGNRSPLIDKVITLNSRTLETENHALMKRPQCPACGEPDRYRQPMKPLQLQSVTKRFRADGGHRSVPPEVTFKRFAKHVSPITGVVSSLTAQSNEIGTDLSYSYSAGHNFALHSRDPLALIRNLRGRSGGKGATEIQAKVSAMCEAIERFSGLYNPGIYEHLARYEDLTQALLPNELTLFSDQQYANRIEWNRIHASAYHSVPERFDSSRPIHWTPALSLSDQRLTYVPSAYCYYGHPESIFCAADANGCAAGNTLEEAILQGFLELVERDSVALWWYNRVKRPRVELDSFHNPYFDQIRDFYASIQRNLWVLDLTTDLGIPTFAAICERIDHPTRDIVLGFGAHFDANLAIMRAMTEVNQFLPAVIKRDGEGNTRYWFPDAEAIRWWKTATLETDPYLVPTDVVRRAADFSNLAADDLKADVERCLQIVADRGMDMLILDQTQPDIGLNVARVMVPGLRHFWKRYGPGRLYDQPVKMGWLDKPTPEHELNPVGIFF